MVFFHILIHINTSDMSYNHNISQRAKNGKIVQINTVCTRVFTRLAKKVTFNQFFFNFFSSRHRPLIKAALFEKITKKN